MTEGELLQLREELEGYPRDEVATHRAALLLLDYVDELHAKLGGDGFARELVNALHERIIKDHKVNKAGLHGDVHVHSLSVHLAGGRVHDRKQGTEIGLQTPRIIVDVRLAIEEPEQKRVMTS